MPEKKSSCMLRGKKSFWVLQPAPKSPSRLVPSAVASTGRPSGATLGCAAPWGSVTALLPGVPALPLHRGRGVPGGRQVRDGQGRAGMGMAALLPLSVWCRTSRKALVGFGKPGLSQGPRGRGDSLIPGYAVPDLGGFWDKWGL